MKVETNERYLKMIERIEPKVYEIYKMSPRKDLIMLYSVSEDKVYSFRHRDFKKMLHPNSLPILKKEYKEAQKSGKIVLYLRDEERQALKSFVI